MQKFGFKNKINPIIDLINERLAIFRISKQVCIDEMMIQSKSKFGPRIYQKGKPHPWGYKLYALSDTFGIVYKMHLYCGAFPQVEGFPDLGSTGNRVLSLIQNVDRDKDVELYMDNFFTSLPLMNELRKLGIHSMGTIRVKDFPGFSTVCMPDKELKDLGTRKFVEYMCTFEGSLDPGFWIIWWNDNSIVNMAHSFGAGFPTEKATGWFCDHNKKKCKNMK